MRDRGALYGRSSEVLMELIMFDGKSLSRDGEFGAKERQTAGPTLRLRLREYLQEGRIRLHDFVTDGHHPYSSKTLFGSLSTPPPLLRASLATRREEWCRTLRERIQSLN